MKLHGLKSTYFCFALGLALSANTTGWADPNAPLPGLGGELGVISVPSSMTYSSLGPQTNLNAPTFEKIPLAIYVEKDLEVALTSQRQKYQQLQMQFDATLKQQDITASKEEQPLTFDEVKAEAKLALEQCQQKGSLCSAKVVQDETAQKILIQVTPLSLESVAIESEDKWQASVLKHLFKQPINQPIQLKKIERQLRLIQTNPDISLKPELEIIPFTNQAKVVLKSEEHRNPMHFGVSLSNLDQNVFGSNFLGGTFVANNVLGYGDSLFLGPVFNYNSQGYFGHYEIPVNTRLRPFIDGGYSYLRPYDRSFSGFDLRGYTWRVTPGVKYVLYDDPNTRVVADAQIDFKQVKTMSGEDVVEREIVNNLRFGVQVDQQWEKTTVSMRNEVAAALDILGARPAFSSLQPIPNSGSQYFRWTGFGFLERQLPGDSSLVINAQWQYSPDSLTLIDQFGIGGTFSGRGYRELFIPGDSGAFLSAQWQGPMYFIPKNWKLPWTEGSARDNLQMLFFVDYGYAYLNDRYAADDQSEHILSVGAGIRVALTKYLSGRLDIGFPLLRNPPFSQEPRLHFGIDATLF